MLTKKSPKKQKLMAFALPIILAAALTPLFSSCNIQALMRGSATLTYANEEIDSKNITGVGFENGAGPWSPPSGCMGVFCNISVENKSASEKRIALWFTSTSTVSYQADLNFTVAPGEIANFTYLKRFNEEQTTIRAWHDGTQGSADLTDVTLNADPTYWLLG